MAEIPTSSAARRQGPGSRLAMLAGIFAVVIGVLLRSAVGGQDQTGWNGVVKAVLEGLPLVLILGGALALIIAGVAILRRPRDPVT